MQVDNRHFESYRESKEVHLVILTHILEWFQWGQCRACLGRQTALVQHDVSRSWQRNMTLFSSVHDFAPPQIWSMFPSAIFPLQLWKTIAMHLILGESVGSANGFDKSR